MNVSPLIDEQVHFGFNLNQEVNAHLQRAAALVGSRAQSIKHLYKALEVRPDQLETLVALYKILFYQGKTEQAEDLVFQALVKSATQGQFSHDWNSLDITSTDWEDPRGPGHFYLYSLKALAFIRLRQEMLRDARQILQALQRIDPEDKIGANVIRDLLAGIEEQ